MESVLKKVTHLLAVLTLLSGPAFGADLSKIRLCETQLLAVKLGELPSDVSVIRPLGKGGQGHVLLVANPFGPYVEKVFWSDSDLAPPGIYKMTDYAVHQAFSLIYVAELFKEMGADVRVVRPMGVSPTNRMGILTNTSFLIADREIHDRENPAPTVSVDYVEGQSIAKTVFDVTVPLAERLALVERVNRLTDQIHKWLERVPKRNLIQNEWDFEAVLIPGENDQGEKIKVYYHRLYVTLGKIPGSPTRSRRVMFSTAWRNILLTKTGELVMIDLD